MARVVETVGLAAPRALTAEPSRRSAVARFMRRQPLGAAGLVLVLALIATALLADVLAKVGITLTRESFGGDLWMATVAQVAPIIPYLLLVLILIFRPKGLLGDRDT